MIDALQYILPSQGRDRALFAFAGIGFLVSLYFLLFVDNQWIPPNAVPIGMVKTEGVIKRRFMKSLQWWNLKDAQQLYRGDSIYTPKDTTAVVRLKGKEKILMGPRSLIKFEEIHAQYVDLVLMRGTFEIAKKGTKIQVAGKGAHVRVASNNLKVRAASKKEKIKVNIRGKNAKVGKQAKEIDIEITEPMKTAMAKASPVDEVLPEVVFDDSRVESVDETKEVSQINEEIFLINDDGKTAKGKSYVISEDHLLRLREVSEPKKHYKVGFGKGEQTISQEELELTKIREEIEDKEIAIIKKPLKIASTLPRSIETTPEINLDVEVSRFSRRSAHSATPVIDLDSKSSSFSSDDDEDDYIETFLTEQPDLPEVGPLPATPTFADTVTSSDVSVPDIPNKSPRAVQFGVDLAPTSGDSTAELATKKMFGLRAKIETLKEEEFRRKEELLKKERKRQSAEAEVLRLRELREKKLAKLQAKKKKLHAAKLAKEKKEKERLLFEQKRKEIEDREWKLATKKTIILKKTQKVKVKPAPSKTEVKASDIFEGSDANIFVEKKKRDKDQKLAQADSRGPNAIDGTGGSEENEVLFEPSVPKLFVKPNLHMAVLSSTDLSGASTISLTSNPGVGIEFGFIYPLKPTFRLGASYGFNILSFRVPAGQPLDDPTTFSRIKIHSEYDASEKFEVRGGLGYEQRPFIASSVSSPLVIDSTWILKMFIELLFKLAKIGTFMFEVEGGGAVLLPKGSTAYHARLGHSEYLRFSISRSINNVFLKAGIRVEYSGQNSSLYSHSLLMGGIDLSAYWSF